MLKLIGTILAHVGLGAVIAVAGFKAATSEAAQEQFNKARANHVEFSKANGFKKFLVAVPAIILGVIGTNLFAMGLMFGAPILAGIGLAVVFSSPLLEVMLRNLCWGKATPVAVAA